MKSSDPIRSIGACAMSLPDWCSPWNESQLLRPRPPVASSPCFPPAPARQIASRRMFNFRPKHEYGGMGRGRGFTLLPLYHSLHSKSPPPSGPSLATWFISFPLPFLLQVRSSLQPPRFSLPRLCLNVPSSSLLALSLSRQGDRLNYDLRTRKPWLSCSVILPPSLSIPNFS